MRTLVNGQHSTGFGTDNKSQRRTFLGISDCEDSNSLSKICIKRETIYDISRYMKLYFVRQRVLAVIIMYRYNDMYVTCNKKRIPRARNPLGFMFYIGVPVCLLLISRNAVS